VKSPDCRSYRQCRSRQTTYHGDSYTYVSSTVNELQNAAGFGFDHGFHDQLSTAIQDGDHNRFLVHVHSDRFDLVTHLSCLLGGKLIRVDACLSLTVKCHFPADLPICSPGVLSSFRTGHTTAVTP
jgi:hypothetical protein